MPAQPDGFHFSPHNTAFFQVTMDGSAAGAGGMGSDGITGNRIQSGAFPQTTFQLAAGPLPEGHLMRRTGPQSPIIHHHHHHQQQQQASPSQASLNSIKFSKVGDRSEIVHPDFFVGANRAPFVSQAMRYEGIPIPSILYQTTGSPVPGRVNNNNNPISFLATQQGDKPHHQFPELATGGQNALLRFPGSRLRADIVSPTIVGASTDNLKYVEVPAAHNIHVLQHAHHGSDGGTRLVASWTQARNLPKREQRHPFLPEQPYSVHLGKGRMRATLRSGVLHGIRANDNLHEARKMDVPKNSPQQSSAQVRRNNKGIKTIPLFQISLPTLLHTHSFRFFTSQIRYISHGRQCSRGSRFILACITIFLPLAISHSHYLILYIVSHERKKEIYHYNGGILC